MTRFRPTRARSLTGLGLTSAVALLVTMPASAQGDAASRPDQVAQVPPGLEEIIVTATRRETRLQETPVSVTAIGEARIGTAVPRDIGDLAPFVPNFSAAIITGFNAASFAMRGVGQTDIIVYLEAPVGVTLDDFVMPSVQSQLIDTFDIERVEVLRGPQGTLFGKNTTGGVVNVITKRPSTTEFSGETELLVGGWGTREAKGAVNVPVVEGKLGLRLVAGYEESDGYYENGACFGPVPGLPAAQASGCGDGSDLGGMDVFAGRAKLLWTPTDSIEALFQYEIVRDNSDSPPVVNETPNDPAWAFFNLGLTQDAGDPLDVAGITNRDDLLLNMSDGHQVDIDGFYANVEWTLGSTVITSVTGYREQSSELPSTYTGEVGPVSLFDANRTDERETFQQELRINTSFGDNIDFVGGAFYQTNDVRFCVVQVLGFLDLFGLTLPFGTFNNNPQVLCNQQDQSAFAVFGDMTWNVNERLTLIGGLRWTWEEKDWAGRNQVFFQALGGGFDPGLTWQDFGSPLEAGDFDRFPNGVVRDSENWSEPTWRASAAYEFTPDVLGYATYSRGFRSGAYNDQTGTSGVPIPALAARPTDPEKADSYEAGVKSEFFDNRFRLNVTAFYVEYTDMQRGLVSTITNQFGQQFQETRFFNAGEATVKGLELEASVVPVENFTLTGILGYLDGEYKTFEADTDFDGDIDVDFSNRPLNRAPEWQWTIDATYIAQLADLGSLTINANLNYEAENAYVYSDVSPAFDSFLEARTLLNASVTWNDPTDRYYVRVFGRNLTDERYNTATLPVGALWTFSSYGPPRFLGASVGARF